MILTSPDCKLLSLSGGPPARNRNRNSSSRALLYCSSDAVRVEPVTMSAQQVAPTRMALQMYKGKLLGAKKGYELLKKKSDALKVR